VPGQHDHFLINAYGLLFDEITASSLVKIDAEGKKVEPSSAEVNSGGFAIRARCIRRGQKSLAYSEQDGRARRVVCSGRGKGTGERDQKRQSANDPRASIAAPYGSGGAQIVVHRGNVRIRLPVAAKIALSTAGAATAIVGSPTPPQKSPVGTTTTSTFGISSMRITL